MMRRVKVGQDFAATVEILEASRKVGAEATRSWLALGLFLLGGLTLAGAAVLGFYNGGSYDELQALWNALGPQLGAIVAYYFGAGARHGRGDDAAGRDTA